MKSSIESVLWETQKLLDKAFLSKSEKVEVSMALMVWSYLSNHQMRPVDTLFSNSREIIINYPSVSASLYWLKETGLRRGLEHSIEGAWELWQAKNPDLLEGVFDSTPKLIKTIAKTNAQLLEQLIEEWISLENVEPHQYQYHSEFFWSQMYSDRSDAHQFFTPARLVDLMLTNLPDENDLRVLDPFCRSGEFLREVASRVSAKQLDGKTPNSISKKFTKVTNLLFTSEHNISVTNSNLSIDTLSGGNYDYVCTNPPFGKDVNKYDSYEGGEWSDFLRVRRLECRYLVKVLNSLSYKGKAAVIMPISFLAGTSTDAFRRKLIEDNLIDAVVQLPSDIFYGTSISAAILFIEKNRNRDDVLFIDARNIGYKQKQMLRWDQEDVLELSAHLKAYHSASLTSLEYIENAKVVGRDEILLNRAELKFDRYTGDARIFSNPFPASEILSKKCLQLKAELDDLDMDISLLMLKDIELEPESEDYKYAAPQESKDMLYARSRRLTAKAQLVSSKTFIVYKDSEMRGNEANSCPAKAKALRKQLIRMGAVTPSPTGDKFIFAQDYVFSSPSAAAAVVSGGSVNGLDFWINHNKHTLNDLRVSL